MNEYCVAASNRQKESEFIKDVNTQMNNPTKPKPSNSSSSSDTANKIASAPNPDQASSASSNVIVMALLVGSLMICLI